MGEIERRRLLVVEDEALMASLLADALTATGFEVDVASNVIDAMESVRAFDPDAALLDISLGPGPSGIDLANALHDRRPDIALLFLTKHPDRRTAGLEGATIPPGCGFLRKDMVKDTAYLLDAINTVLADHPDDVRHDLAADRPLASLTTPQLEVLRMAAQGLTNTAIAHHRGTSERAVELLLHSVFVALDIDSRGDVNPRVEAIRRYIQAAGMPERP
jgi:DNA-binding NarL/FixJ family response regulator